MPDVAGTSHVFPSAWFILAKFKWNVDDGSRIQGLRYGRPYSYQIQVANIRKGNPVKC